MPKAREYLFTRVQSKLKFLKLAKKYFINKKDGENNRK